MLLGGQMTCLLFPPFALYSTAWFWLFNRLLISQAIPFTDEASKTNCLLGRTERTRKGLFWQISICHLPLCTEGPSMGIRRSMELIDDTKQAMSMEKRCPVEINLTSGYGPIRPDIYLIPEFH